MPRPAAAGVAQVDKIYKDLKPVGKGSYGIVCSAVNSVTGEAVAIKKVSPISTHVIDAKHVLREIRMMRWAGSSICDRRRPQPHPFTIFYLGHAVTLVVMYQVPGQAREHHHAQGPVHPGGRRRAVHRHGAARLRPAPHHPVQAGALRGPPPLLHAPGRSVGRPSSSTITMRPTSQGVGLGCVKAHVHACATACLLLCSC